MKLSYKYITLAKKRDTDERQVFLDEKYSRGVSARKARYIYIYEKNIYRKYEVIMKLKRKEFNNSLWLLIYKDTDVVDVDCVFEHKPSVKELKKLFKELDIDLEQSEIEELVKNETLIFNDDQCQYVLLERTYMFVFTANKIFLRG